NVFKANPFPSFWARTMGRLCYDVLLVPREPEANEPLLEQSQRHPLQQLNPAPVDLTQVVIGIEEGGYATLVFGTRNAHGYRIQEVSVQRRLSCARVQLGER